MFGLVVRALSCAAVAMAANQGALLAGTTGQARGGQLRHAGHGQGEGFVRALQFKHRLRVCNAYPYSAAIDVYRGRGERLTGAAPMPYKTCRDFLSPLRQGDKLDFKVGDASAGTFLVADLPSNDAVLLLVIHRHDTLSTAVSFESHVFGKHQSAQVAIIDTYKGSRRATPEIMDAAEDPKKRSRKEELRYDSVVAVNPGKYRVVLAGGHDGAEAEAESELVALDHESYIVLRTGVEAQEGPSFPQELVVYPQSDASALHSGAAHARAAAALLPLVAALVGVAWL